MKGCGVLVLLCLFAAACEHVAPVAPTTLVASSSAVPLSVSGIVGGVTSSGLEPLEGAEVWTTASRIDDPSSWAVTDASGRYHITLIAGTVTVYAAADGYKTASRSVTITANTALDFELQPQ